MRVAKDLARRGHVHHRLLVPQYLAACRGEGAQVVSVLLRQDPLRAGEQELEQRVAVTPPPVAVEAVGLVPDLSRNLRRV